MNVFVTRIDETGTKFNSDGEEVISCSTGCGTLTTMTGTKLCDACWEANRRKENLELFGYLPH